MMTDRYLNDIRDTLEKGFHNACEAIAKAGSNGWGSALGRALATACVRATYEDGDLIKNGYVANCKMFIHVGNDTEIVVNEGDELFIKDGAVRIMSSGCRGVKEVRISSILFVEYEAPKWIEHLWGSNTSVGTSSRS